MKKLILIFALFLPVSASFAQKKMYDYKFRLLLKDKGETKYTTEKPEDFLSEKSILRRQRQKIAVDSTDLPISDAYLRMIENAGSVVVAKSKWLKTVSVHCEDSAKVEELKSLPFVKDAVFVWRGERQGIDKNVYSDSVRLLCNNEVVFGNRYAYALDNIKPFDGRALHKAGFKGKGIDIAIIDAGFSHLPNIELLDNIDIKGYKGFVYGKEDIFNTGSQHGLNVLSCIATNKPMLFIGTAPEASFWLFGSEDERSEYPIEEDYWATAIEYADSVGVDVVNSSLGYTNFDYPAKSYTHKDLDGKTAFISCAANIASNKGMLLVCSAGNSGNDSWGKISFPADAFGVLTVGAIKRDSLVTGFSSCGFTADLRVKPDVVALGDNSVVVRNNGQISYASGTSFSSPITTGIVACLWQAFPELTNKELISIIQQSSDNYDDPNEKYGYGIPNMPRAMELAQKVVIQKRKNVDGHSAYFRIEPDSAR